MNLTKTTIKSTMLDITLRMSFEYKHSFTLKLKIQKLTERLNGPYTAQTSK